MFTACIPSVTVYPSTRTEVNDISMKVDRLLKEGIPPAQIAILYSDPKFGKAFLKSPAFRRLPIHIDAGYDLLSDPFISKLFHLLSYLAKESQHPGKADELLFELLSFNVFEIPVTELTSLLLTAGARKRIGPQNSLRKNLAEQGNMPPQDLFDPGLHPALKKTSLMLERLIRIAGESSLQDLFSALITDEIIESYIDRTAEPRLRDLISVVEELIHDAASHEPGFTLQQFMEATTFLQKEKRPLHPLTNRNKSAGVHFLPQEQAPGVQSEYVFVAGLANVFLQDGFEARESGLGWRGSVQAIQNTPEVKEPAEQLLDVCKAFATTKNLHLSYSTNCEPGSASGPSLRLAGLLNLQQDGVIQFSINPGAEEVTAMKPPLITQPFSRNEELLKNSVRRFIMSASALNTWLECPRSFYYKYILRVPSGGNEATAFGSAVHHALEQCFRHMQEGKQDQFPECDFLVNQFNDHMRLNRANFSSEAFTKRMVYGAGVLTNYYEYYHRQWKKIVSVELNISGVVVNGVPLKGKIDKLEFDGRKVNVVDYKTGDLEKALRKLKPPTEEDPNGGDYWRQAVFYKILVDNYGSKDWRVTSSEIDFIEPGKNHVLHKHQFAITGADVETVQQQFTLAWQQIHNGAFDAGCGRDDCRWCNLGQDQ